MEKLPDPPSNFPIPPVLEKQKAGSRLWRIYLRAGDHPTVWSGFRTFGPTSSRFDHHTYPKRVQSRGIIYATAGSAAILTALAEFFQSTRHIDRFHNEPWLAAFDLVSPLKLLDMGGTWPVQAGGNMAINSGSRNRARKWSRAIYREYESVEGIWYPSSLTNAACVALYERAAHALPPSPAFNRPLGSKTLLDPLTELAVELGYTLH